MPKTKPTSGVRNKLGLFVAALLLLGPGLAWLRLVPGMVGFVMFALGGLGAVVMAIASVVQAARGHGLGLGGAVAVVAGIAFMVLASLDAGAPTINDFTTDLEKPPTFEHAATLPANAGRDLSYPEAFADIQKRCCADLRPARLPVPQGLAFARARDTATRMGWTVTQDDYGAGRIEAVASSRLFGFQDDIVIRVTEVSSQISRVDVRSKSRDGKGDLGANAARIRAYVASVEKTPGLAALPGTTTP